MATPLYKKMKTKGISFYAFPSATEDITIANQNPDYTMNFSKFILLNLPAQNILTLPKKFDFRNSFKTNDPNPITSKFSDQLVESLRNYVANYDVNIRQAKINSNTDFYNVSENKTTTEKIFWKWLKKLNIIDFEPAIHLVDWDKTQSDFDNPNGSTNDYFRKYLWKERDVNYYNVYKYMQTSGNKLQVEIKDICKFRAGDIIYFSGSTGSYVTGGTSTPHTIVSVTFSTTGTSILTSTNCTGTFTPSTTSLCYLAYKRVVQYIGEINATSNVLTSKRNFTEVTAFIPHEAGMTPTVLWEINSDTNYKPNMEYPMYSPDKQNEIMGAENLNSPIRTTPANYPGSFYSQYDTTDKTYVTSNGDSLRYSGKYYGINLTNSVGLSDPLYFEKLDNFSGVDLDGLNVDFNTNHYAKMQLVNYKSDNFDEFNAMPLNNTAPSDFDFNAILWYYEINNNGNVTKNLYGISFLNNPENDDDVYSSLITPYHKLVLNENQDGLSYIFDLNLTFDIDNNMVSPHYDPSSITNLFGFDLYNNVMTMLGKLQENFISISNQFINMSNDVNNVKSLVYTQTDIEYLKNQISNLENLLKLYQTNQIVDSDTIQVTPNYSGVYPTLSLNVVDLEYKEMETITTTSIYNYNTANINSPISNSYNVTIPTNNKKLLRIVNDDLNGVESTLKIVLDSDLKYKQEFDIIISADKAYYSKKLNVYLNFNDGVNGEIETLFLSELDMPVDLSKFTETSTTYNRNHYFTNRVLLYANSATTTGTTNNYTIIYTTTDNIFKTSEYVYISNLVYMNDITSEIVDYSGLYKISKVGTKSITIDLETIGYTLYGVPVISSYKGMKIKIVRVDESSLSTIRNRYLIENTIY